jgi:hypothetical protein
MFQLLSAVFPWLGDFSPDQGPPLVALRLSHEGPIEVPRLVSFPSMYRSQSLLEECFGPQLASKAMRQTEIDRQNIAFTPLLMYSFENTPQGHIDVNPVSLETTEISTIFEVLNQPNRVLKYLVNPETVLLHPLLREAWFLSDLGDTELVPKIFFLSPPTVLEWTATPKTAFAFTSEERRKCVSSECHVRFVLMERVGQSVAGPNMQLAMNVLKWVLEALAVIHDRGIVHGNIHAQNIAFKQSSFRLIDFGHAMSEEEIETNLKNNPKPFFPSPECAFSQWEVEGYVSSFRDDVFRSILVAVSIINGGAWYNYCKDLDLAGMRQYKQETSLVDFPGSVPIDNRVKETFERMLAHVRSLEFLDRPNYRLLLNQFV